MVQGVGTEVKPQNRKNKTKKNNQHKRASRMAQVLEYLPRVQLPTQHTQKK
jgi:hypothetical protein